MKVMLFLSKCVIAIFMFSFSRVLLSMDVLIKPVEQTTDIRRLLSTINFQQEGKENAEQLITQLKSLSLEHRVQLLAHYWEKNPVETKMKTILFSLDSHSKDYEYAYMKYILFKAAFMSIFQSFHRYIDHLDILLSTYYESVICHCGCAIKHDNYGDAMTDYQDNCQKLGITGPFCVSACRECGSKIILKAPQ